MNKAFEYESKYKDGKLIERRWSVGPILVSGVVALVLGLAGKAFIPASLLPRLFGHDRLQQAIEKALATGCTDPAAVRHLLHAGELKHTICEVIDVGLLERYERPLPVMNEYDRLLQAGGAQ
jgi:hypothetical protein